MASNSGWNSGNNPGDTGFNQSENNTSFFNVFPVGARYDDGSYQGEGMFSVSWAMDENESGDVWFRSISAQSSNIDASSIGKSFGLSVRMVQD